MCVSLHLTHINILILISNLGCYCKIGANVAGLVKIFLILGLNLDLGHGQG